MGPGRGFFEPMSITEPDGAADAYGLAHGGLTPSWPTKNGVKMGAGRSEAQQLTTDDAASSPARQPSHTPSYREAILRSTSSPTTSPSADDAVEKLKAEMATLHHEPVGQFYPAPARKTAKKKERMLLATLRCTAPAISKQSSKSKQIGEEIKRDST